MIVLMVMAGQKFLACVADDFTVRRRYGVLVVVILTLNMADKFSSIFLLNFRHAVN